MNIERASLRSRVVCGKMSTMNKRAIVISLVCAVASLAAACEPEINKEVMIVGDSIAVGAADEVTQTFNAVEEGNLRYLPSFAAAIGQGLTVLGDGVPEGEEDAFWRAHMDSLMEHGYPEAIVMSIGINDCPNTSGYGDRVDNLMSRVPAEIRVHWMTVPDPKSVRTCDGTINAALKSAVGRWPNLTLLPWAATANQHPEWFQSDTIHHTPEGQQKYAEFLKSQMDHLYPAPG